MILFCFCFVFVLFLFCFVLFLFCFVVVVAVKKSALHLTLPDHDQVLCEMFSIHCSISHSVKTHSVVVRGPFPKRLLLLLRSVLFFCFALSTERLQCLAVRCSVLDEVLFVIINIPLSEGTVLSLCQVPPVKTLWRGSFKNAIGALVFVHSKPNRTK